MERLLERLLERLPLLRRELRLRAAFCITLIARACDFFTCAAVCVHPRGLEEALMRNPRLPFFVMQLGDFPFFLLPGLRLRQWL